ncbi:MAG: lipoate--protein ligase family protein [Candidatus Natronoplasma sp.]
MKWRLAPLEEMDPYRSIALEEVLLKNTNETGKPILRFWKWNSKAVTIGRFQNVNNEVDIELCRDKKIKIIRRPSGGGTMFHSAGDEIVYSVIAKKELFPNDIIKRYEKVCGHITTALQNMGVDAKFEKPNSVSASGLKISGSAQKVTRKSVLLHGTILYTPNKEEMFSVLNTSDPCDDRYIKSNITPVAGVKEIIDISFQKFYDKIKEEFLKDKQYFTKYVTEEELEEADKLAEEKYKKNSWNLTI